MGKKYSVVRWPHSPRYAETKGDIAILFASPAGCARRGVAAAAVGGGLAVTSRCVVYRVVSRGMLRCVRALVKRTLATALHAKLTRSLTHSCRVCTRHASRLTLASPPYHRILVGAAVFRHTQISRARYIQARARAHTHTHTHTHTRHHTRARAHIPYATPRRQTQPLRASRSQPLSAVGRPAAVFRSRGEGLPHVARAIRAKTNRWGQRQR